MKASIQSWNDVIAEIKKHVPAETHAQIDDIAKDLVDLSGHLKTAGWMGAQLGLMCLASTIHFCRLAGKPHGKNEETGPDYDAMAEEACELASESMPSLFRALGLEEGEEAK